MIKLDEYEQNILQSVENGEWKSKNNTDNRLLEKKTLENSITGLNKENNEIFDYLSSKFLLLLLIHKHN